MKPELSPKPSPPDALHVTPDELDALAHALREQGSPHLQIDSFLQFSGRRSWAFTFWRPEPSAQHRPRLFVSRAHAHEPAGTAACTELVRILAGLAPSDPPRDAWRDWVLDHVVVTFLPDANPGGSRRAPVKFWDGSAIPNERFFRWMFGASSERPGERFPRLACWDARKVSPPALLGIAYEQVDAFTYVEPNRDYRSTLFQAFFDLDRRFGYDVWLDLHQTEFINSERNCAAFLPCCWDRMPEPFKDRTLAVVEAIHKRWGREGGRTVDAPMAPYRDNDTQRNFLSRAWLPVASRLVPLVTEVQNNSPRTPVAAQVRLQIAAVDAVMGWMAAQAGAFGHAG